MKEVDILRKQLFIGLRKSRRSRDYIYENPRNGIIATKNATLLFSPLHSTVLLYFARLPYPTDCLCSVVFIFQDIICNDKKQCRLHNLAEKDILCEVNAINLTDVSKTRDDRNPLLPFPSSPLPSSS